MTTAECQRERKRPKGQSARRTRWERGEHTWVERVVKVALLRGWAPLSHPPVHHRVPDAAQEGRRAVGGERSAHAVEATSAQPRRDHLHVEGAQHVPICR